MAFPENHDEEPALPPLPPAPEPEPLPAPDEHQAEQLAQMDELAEQLSTEDAAPQSPTEEVQSLPMADLDVSTDFAERLYQTLDFNKHPDQFEKEQRDEQHRQFLKDAEEFVSVERTNPEAPAEETPRTTYSEDEGLETYIEELPETTPPKPQPAEKLREYQGEPARDFAQQNFPQGDRENPIAEAEADLRSAMQEKEREQLELIESMTEMMRELASEYRRLRSRLEADL